MKRAAILLTVFTLVLVTGCRTTGPRENLGHEGGEAYADVPVPEGYTEYDIPPFKRQDGAGGKRIYGRYAYRSTGGIDKASGISRWFREELPMHGWDLQTDELDDEANTMSARFEKEDDILLVTLEPDNRKRGTERFSVLTIEMNPQYD